MKRTRRNLIGTLIAWVPMLLLALFVGGYLTFSGEQYAPGWVAPAAVGCCILFWIGLFFRDCFGKNDIRDDVKVANQPAESRS